MRYFTPWQRPQEIEDYYLESIVGKITGQYKVPFGDAVISTRDTCLGLETCEELFTPNGYALQLRNCDYHANIYVGLIFLMVLPVWPSLQDVALFW